MSTTTPSKGTHFSDGVRVGPILGSTFIPGANVLTPSVMVSTPNDQAAPGVFDTPMSLLDFTPAAPNVDNLALPNIFPGAGYTPLNLTNSAGTTVITYQGIPNVIMLDVPRNVTTGGASGVVGPTYLVIGWDEYGIPMTEQITPLASGLLVFGKKAFKYIRAIHSSAATTGAVYFGTGITFGLPYFVASPNYVFSPVFNGVVDNGSIIIGNNTTRLANNAISTTNGSSIVTMLLTGSNPVVQSEEYVIGEWITLSGATTVGGIPVSELDGEYQIVNTNDAADTISIDVLYKATSTVAAGGGATINLRYGASIATGDQHIATAITGDVRGTYTPFEGPDGLMRLTINMYNASGDARKYNNALSSNSNPILNGSKFLYTDPMVVNNATNIVYVYAPDHQLTNGEFVTISGATTFGGLTTGAININAPVTIINSNAFSYIANGTATSSAVGGGASVTITPGIGNLYQTSIGRYGVAQYNLSPIPNP